MEVRNPTSRHIHTPLIIVEILTRKNALNGKIHSWDGGTLLREATQIQVRARIRFRIEKSKKNRDQ